MDAVVCPAAEFSLSDMRLAMNAAFEDYAIPMCLSKDAFERMMVQRGLETSVSRVAVVDGKIVAFWFMSVREHRTYLISSGTIPQFRSKGLSGALASEVLKRLRAKNVVSIQTEVLEGNLKAQRLYDRIGLKTHRVLGCCELHKAGKHGPVLEEIRQGTWKDLSEFAIECRDWSPSWQNNDCSIAALKDDAVCLVAHRNGDPVGFLALFHRTHTIAQIAVKKSSRRQGIGTALIRSAFDISSASALRLINYDGSDVGFAKFLRAHDYRPTEGQLELRMAL